MKQMETDRGRVSETGLMDHDPIGRTDHDWSGQESPLGARICPSTLRRATHVKGSNRLGFLPSGPLT